MLQSKKVHYEHCNTYTRYKSHNDSFALRFMDLKNNSLTSEETLEFNFTEWLGGVVNKTLCFERFINQLRSIITCLSFIFVLLIKDIHGTVLFYLE